MLPPALWIPSSQCSLPSSGQSQWLVWQRISPSEQADLAIGRQPAKPRHMRMLSRRQVNEAIGEQRIAE